MSPSSRSVRICSAIRKFSLLYLIRYDNDSRLHPLSLKNRFPSVAVMLCRGALTRTCDASAMWCAIVQSSQSLPPPASQAQQMMRPSGLRTKALWVDVTSQVHTSPRKSDILRHFRGLAKSKGHREHDLPKARGLSPPVDVSNLNSVIPSNPLDHFSKSRFLGVKALRCLDSHEATTKIAILSVDSILKSDRGLTTGFSRSSLPKLRKTLLLQSLFQPY